jgi:hypothetical protein
MVHRLRTIRITTILKRLLAQCASSEPSFTLIREKSNGQCLKSLRRYPVSQPFSLRPTGSPPVELRKAAFWAAPVSQPKSEAQLRVFLDECLRGTNEVVRSYFSGRLSSEELLNEYNPQIIDRFYKESIIIEQSPPSGIPFGQLAKGASSASIGALEL